MWKTNRKSNNKINLRMKFLNSRRYQRKKNKLIRGLRVKDLNHNVYKEGSRLLKMSKKI